MAVIEGTLSDGAHPTVLFSSSIVPDKDGNLRDALVNWGKVTISDGEREVIMTGYPDERYLPPFRYQTLDMTGEPGKTYTITASFMNLYATAACRLPFPTRIDSVVIKRTDIDTLCSATLYFTSPDDTPAYYYLTMRSGAEIGREAPCMMGTVKTDEPGRVYSMAVLRPRLKIDGLTHQSQLIVGEEWIVSLNRVEREVYEFWRAYDNMILFSSSPFLNSSESLPTNIEGGYGVWSPQGSSRVSFMVGRDSIVYGADATER
ncbi:MAG: DUF4249 domain-containing protein [Muribaculaceae bacterium]|nr:DUF4249 domain-containing protein [Muribaculaceae bacterium]